MKIFITGASGFVGGAIVKSLGSSHEFFAMARSERSSNAVIEVGAKPMKCDLESITADHLQGCETVIHCAAYAEEWGSEADFFDANVKGTKNIVKAAKLAGVKRFIFIGTEAALFKGQDMLNIDETYPYADASPYPYSRTKGLAEKYVLQSNTSEFQTISLRPRMIWGPGDQSILPSILKMIRSDKFAWIGQGKYQTSTTHISNLVRAVELSLNAGKGGESYFITDREQQLMRDFLTKYIKTQISDFTARSTSKGIARFLAKFLEMIWKTFKLKSKPPMVRFTIDIMSSHCTVNIAKAEKDLGYSPIITVDEGLRAMPRLAT